MTDEELRVIRERSEKAYPGPWQAELVEDRRKSVDWDETVIADGEPELAFGPTFQTVVRFGTADHRNVLPFVDADLPYFPTLDFIAHAREDVPALLAEVERLRGLVGGRPVAAR